ncbi:GNAT family N-acetyltransferase [uncultured Mesonia sp.]|uniref:GNAT family N-acetyltransferase n=1 Tax=uncultured Mesonia sp. TaxID=399731 RepID=UPI00374FA467
MSLTLKKATPNLYSASSGLILQAMDELIYYYLGKEDIGEAKKFLSQEFQKEDSLYSYRNTFLAFLGDKVVGALIAYDGAKHKDWQKNLVNTLAIDYNFNNTLSPETQAGHFYLDAISVDPDYRGQKIGSKLIKYAESYARGYSFEYLGLLVDLANPKAKRLYERLGFELDHLLQLGEHEYYYLKKDLR